MAADTVHVFKDDAGEYRWTRKAPNGEPVATSGEGYTRKSDATKAWKREVGDDPVNVSDETGE